METKKAMLNVIGNSYPVIYEGVCAGRHRLVLDWESLGDLPEGAKKRTFDRFIKDIGHSPSLWEYPQDADVTYYVSQGILTFKDEVEEEPVRDSEHDHWKLTGVASRKLEEFSSEGYSIVRVEHSQDMNEGTITLHYKKEEA